jgi:DNA-binding transcriptional regulator YiaG
MPMSPKQLRQARKGLGLTQQALADRLGVHVQTVKKWEADDRRIPEPVAILLRVWLKDGK